MHLRNTFRIVLIFNFTEIVKFVSPQSAVQAFGQGEYGHIIKIINLRKSSLLLYIIFKKTKLLHFDLYEVLYIS